MSGFSAPDSGNGSVRNSTDFGTLYAAIVDFAQSMISGLGQLDARLRHDDRVHGFAPEVVRDPDHRDLRDAGCVEIAFSTSIE